MEILYLLNIRAYTIVKTLIEVVNYYPYSNYGRCSILKLTAALWACVR